MQPEKERKPFTPCQLWHINMARLSRKLSARGQYHEADQVCYSTCPFCGHCPPPCPDSPTTPRPRLRSDGHATPAKRQARYRARNKADDDALLQQEIAWQIDCADLLLS